MTPHEKENAQDSLLSAFCEGWKSATGMDPEYGKDFGDLFGETLVAGYSNEEDARQLGISRAKHLTEDEQNTLLNIATATRVNFDEIDEAESLIRRGFVRKDWRRNDMSGEAIVLTERGIEAVKHLT